MAVSALALTAAGASAWTAPVNVSATTFSDRAPDAGIAADQTGTVVWQRDGFAYHLIQLRSRSAAGVWGPVRNLSSGERPAMAVAADGTTVIAWVRSDAFGSRPRVSVGDPGGTMSAPADAAPPEAPVVDAVDVGIAADGTAVVAWRRNGQVEARVRRPDGTFGPVASLAAAGASAPVVAVARSGAGAIAWSTADRVELAQVSVAGDISAARPMTTTGVADSPDVGVADDGGTLVVWHRAESGVGRVQYRPVAGDGTITASGNLSPQGIDSADPAVAVNPSGDAIFAWRRVSGGQARVQAVTRTAGGSVGARRLLSSPGADASAPDADLSDGGKGVVVWHRLGAHSIAQTRSLFLDGTAGELANLGNSTENVRGQPLVDLNETGGSLIAWHRFDGSVLRVRAAVGAPSVQTTMSGLTVQEGVTQTIDPGLEIVDDDRELTGATVAITAGFLPGEDVLGFTDTADITGSYDGATGVLTLAGTASLADYQAALRSVTYENAGDDPSSAVRTVSFRADDAAFTGRPGTRTLAVSAVNDAPEVTLTAGALSYTENATTAVDAQLTVTDPDDTVLEGATVQITGNLAAAEDVLGFTDQNGISGSYDAATGLLTLTGTSSVANYQAALRSVTYSNTSDDPSPATRTVTVIADDGSDLSVADTRDIDITAVDDAPVLANIEPTALDYQENDPATAITSTLTVTDPDGDITGATVEITSNFAAGEEGLQFVDQNGISGSYANGKLTLSGAATPAQYQAALRSVEYRNTSDDPSPLTRTVTFQAAGSNQLTRDIDVTAINDNPSADDETFDTAAAAIGNTVLIGNAPGDGAPARSGAQKGISADILAGDTDVDSGTLTVQAVTDQTTNDGGKVTIESDGDFVYTPAAATSCSDHSDFFDYTVSDGDTGTDTGRVTIAINGCVWYVSNSAGGNSGTSDAPFDTLAQAETASGANQTVFVFDGTNTSSGYGGDGYAMNAGERLIGEHEGLVVDPDGGGGPLGSEALLAANPGARPTLTATGADVIDLNSGNEVRGFDLAPPAGSGGIFGGAGDNSGTIDDVNVGSGGTQAGLELNGSSGTFTITNLSINTSSTGVLLNNAGTTDFGSTTITTSGAKGLDATGTNMSTSSFGSITVGAATAGAVSLTNTGGATTFDGLALTTTSGATPAFAVSNGGSVTVTSAGTANVSATGGPAVDVTGTSGATLSFDDVDSTNSANDGVNLDGLGTGTFSANASSTIGGAAGIAFDLNGGSGDVTFAGAINNGGGATAEVTGRSGGAVTFGGAINDSNDAAGGVSIANNTAGSTTFSGSSKVLNTGASDAVSFTNSDGHTLSLTGGGLDVDATSGQGITATSSGTLIITGTGNSSTTLTGRALNMSATDIGTGGVNFQSLASNGAVNGINLNTTGSTAGLTVTGNAGTCDSAANCTGGAIQGSSGAGIDLTSVGGGVSLTRMSVNGGGDDGIRGATVNGLSLANTRVVSNGNAVGENGIEMAQLTGSGGMASSTVSGSGENNVVIANTSGNLSAFTVTGSTFASTNVTTGDDGFNIQNNGTGAMTTSVTGSTFTDNKGDHFNAGTNASATGTIGVTFTNNTLTTTAGADPDVIGGGITLAPSGGADMTFNVSNNTVQQAFDEAINLNLGTASTSAASMIGTVSGNTVGTAGAADSGSESGTGISVVSNGAGVTTASVTGNQVFQFANPYGILLNSKEGSSNMNLTVTGNTVANPGTFAINGIRVDAGAAIGDSGTMCVGLSGNTAAGSGPGVDPDIRLRQRFNTTIRLPGYGGLNTDTAAVNTFVAGNNPGSDVTSAQNVAGGGGGFAGGAACATP